MLTKKPGRPSPSSAPSRTARTRFGRSFLLAIGAIVFGALALSISFIGYSARVQDQQSVAASVEAMNDFMASEIQRVARVAKDYAWWNDAVRFTTLNVDLDWADRNLGGYVYDTFGLELSFVIAADDSTTYAAIEGERAAADVFELVGSGLDELLAAARAVPADRPAAVSGLVEVEGGILMVALCTITPELGTELTVPSEQRSVLMVAKRVNEEFLATVPSIVRVTQLRIEPAAPVDGELASLPLVAADGAPLATLVWRPERPGSAMLARVMPILGVALAILAAGGTLVLLYAKRTGDALQASEARFRDVADATSDWIWETDTKLRVTYLSSRFAEAMGVPVADMLGRTLTDVLSPLPGHEDLSAMVAIGEPCPAFRDVLCGYSPADGQRQRSLKLAGVPIYDRLDRHVGYRGTATDITTELEAQSRARFLALHDPLTELPNRTLFSERLEQSIKRLSRLDRGAAMLCIDLDRFKEVNDELGHEAGDRLLRAVGQRLRANVRDVDTVARMGGDEFVILQLGLNQPDDAQKLCQRLLNALEEPIDVGGRDLVITASIGIALLPQDGATAEVVLRNADMALLRAKQTGRNTFSFFEQGMDARIQKRAALEHDMRAALKAQQFTLAYQPRINLKSNRVAGVEALVRWEHPREGLLLPGEFISVAEESGLILALGEWILRTACAQAKSWPGLTLAVNISPVQFKSRNFLQAVRDALAETGLEPGRLELEVTEGILLENTEQSVATLRELRELGVRLSMDDFGTGFASLSYLLRFEFDKIKIDRSFVLSVSDRISADAIVRSVLGLGHSLGMEVCAEGVETLDQLDFLRREGCDEVQGFLFSEPVRPDEVDLLASSFRLLDPAKFRRLGIQALCA